MISQNLDASEDKRLSFNSSPILVTQPSDSEDVSGLIRLASLLHGLRRTWLRAFPIAILFCAGGAALGWFLSVPKYAASAFLRIDADDRPLIFQTADETVGKSDFKLYKNTQQQMLKIPFVINSAMRSGELASLPEIAEQMDPMGGSGTT